MNTLSFDFSKAAGVIKPMHAVNNGPTDPGVRQTKASFSAYKAARFPYARNHDASFYAPYGGEHIVDVHRIFKNFDADETDPNAYIFEPTDQYLKLTMEAGTKVFYRLGATIEHQYKYGTRVPKDMAKWARICEHIIAHYTEGWADGFHYDIEYWEIWNEPDCWNKQGINPNWQGTAEEFLALYEIAATHLKKRFPHLKIGGPAFCGPWPTDFRREFLKQVKEKNLPLDFYSYHWYGTEPEWLANGIQTAQEELKLAGLEGTPTILNEWNYIRGWLGEEWEYSLKTEKNLKGAAFVASALCVAQANPLDMLMYYDARPCGMNGLFDRDTFAPLKPYFAMYAFADLYDMGTYVKAEGEVPYIYTCAAKNETEAGILLTYFDDNDDGFFQDRPVAEKEKTVTLHLKNPFPEREVTLSCYLTDETHDHQLVREETQKGECFDLTLNVSLFDNWYIHVK